MPVPKPLTNFAFTLAGQSLQLGLSAAGLRDLPDVSLPVFPWMLGPLPRLSQWCTYPFLPTQLRPSRNGYTVGTLAFTRTTTSVRTVISGLQSFLYVQASRFACHPGRSYRCGLPPQGSCDFYFRAPYELLPPHTSDMLAVRFGQLTAGDFHPIRVRSVVGRIQPFKRFSDRGKWTSPLAEAQG